MIKIKKNMNMLKDTIKIIENINPEIDFVFCSEGIIVKAIDPAGVSIGIFKIKKEMFESYDVTEQKICTFQVNLLSKILKKVGKNELSISFEEDRVNFNTVKDKFSLKFFIGNEDDRPEPEVKGDSQWEINTNEFFTNIKEFAEFAEIIKIKTTEDILSLGTKSNLIEGNSITESLPIKNGVVQCWYSLSNFTMITPIYKIFNTAVFQFSNDSPCMITAENDNLKFKWVLAPRIEE